jgi:RHS repeat-associated protein
MTSDGTNVYAWDAENRLVKITYPSSNNKTEFTYGPTGARMKIVETVNGSVTSTKQFIGGEERDGSGNVTKQFFSLGQRNGSSNFFYGPDHLGSIRTMTDNSGVVQASSGFDAYGRPTKLEGTADSDFGFAGMYVHARSGLNLTPGRPYNAVLGRWTSRDPIEEEGGLNLYGYVGNLPVNAIDPLGTDTLGGLIGAGLGGIIGANLGGQLGGGGGALVGSPGGLGGIIVVGGGGAVGGTIVGGTAGALIGGTLGEKVPAGNIIRDLTNQMSGAGSGSGAAGSGSGTTGGSINCKPDPCDPNPAGFTSMQGCLYHCFTKCPPGNTPVPFIDRNALCRLKCALATY